jgi:cysteine desulfurase
LLSLSAHKFGGPKGVGLMVVSNGATPEPILLGGGQERGRRSGTIDVAGAVGAAAALNMTTLTRTETSNRVRALRDELLDALLEIGGVNETVSRSVTAPGIAHICLDDLDSEALLFMLDEADVYASAASACASGAMESSHVLSAIGVADELRSGALRLSLGHSTSANDIDRAVSSITRSIQLLRDRRAARKQRAT